MGSHEGNRKHSILNPFHREKHTSADPLIDADKATSDTVELVLPLSGGGEEHLVVPDDKQARDPHNADGDWNFHRDFRRASAAASDTGDTPKGASDVEKVQFVGLMRDTQGMSPEEVKAYLQKRGVVDGGKVYFPKGEGAQQMTGADGGAF